MLAECVFAPHMWHLFSIASAGFILDNSLSHGALAPVSSDACCVGMIFRWNGWPTLTPRRLCVTSTLLKKWSPERTTVWPVVVAFCPRVKYLDVHQALLHSSWPRSSKTSRRSSMHGSNQCSVSLFERTFHSCVDFNVLVKHPSKFCEYLPPRPAATLDNVTIALAPFCSMMQSTNCAWQRDGAHGARHLCRMPVQSFDECFFFAAIFGSTQTLYILNRCC